MATINFTFSILGFVSSKIFPILIERVGVDGCLTMYGIGCVVGAIYVIFLLKDTTGQSLDDIGVEERSKEKQDQTTKV